MQILRLYDKNRTILNREGRKQRDATLNLKSEPADRQPDVGIQAPKSSSSGEINNQVAADQIQRCNNTT